MARRKSVIQQDPVTPATCWQIFSVHARDIMRRWREGTEYLRKAHPTERDMVTYLLKSNAFNYEKRIAGFIERASEAGDAELEMEAACYAGRFWYGGQPDA